MLIPFLLPFLYYFLLPLLFPLLLTILNCVNGGTVFFLAACKKEKWKVHVNIESTKNMRFFFFMSLF